MESYRKTVSSLIEQHSGRVIDSPGDNVLSEFGSVVDAVQCAVEIQQVIDAKNIDLPAKRKMEFRIGINLGDVIEEGDRIYGDGVNLAARIEGMADPGSICISGSAYDQIKSKLALGYEDLGEHSVKNITDPVRVYRIPIKLRTGIGSGRGAERPLADRPSIAVLPFDNMSGDQDQEYFSDGMAEEIITLLSKSPQLLVIARNSTFVYKGKPTNVQEIGRDLHARYVLQGSVRRAGNRLRITAQLIDATTGSHIWAERYDRETGDVFALQDEIAQKISAAAIVGYKGSERERVRRKPTENLSAYDLVLRGQEHYRRRTREENRTARQLYEKAVELDPDYALAYSKLAATYRRDFDRGWGGFEAMDKAFELSQKAIALDDSAAFAHHSLALVYRYRGQYDLAFAESERAIALEPSNPDVYISSASVMAYSGKREDSIGYIETAMQLNPHYPVYYSLRLGTAYLDIGRYEDAASVFEKDLARDTTGETAYGLSIAYRVMWENHHTNDRYVLRRSLEMAQKAVAYDSEDLHYLLALCEIQLARKEYEPAMATAERAMEINPDHGLSHSAIAICWNAMGRPQDTIDLRAGAADTHTHLATAYRLAGQLQEAESGLKAYLAMPSRIIWHAKTACVELVILYSDLGREDEARAGAATVLELMPYFSAEAYGERIPYADPSQTARDMAALRAAGL